MIQFLSKLFSHRKSSFVVPPKPKWEETVMLMRHRSLRSLHCFDDKVVKVIYSQNNEQRFILFESKKGYFYYIVEYLTELDDEEWRYVVAQNVHALPAMWVSASRTSSRSIFGQTCEAWNDFIASPEYKKYFFDPSFL